MPVEQRMTTAATAAGHEGCRTSREGCLVVDPSPAAGPVNPGEIAALVTAQRGEGYRFTYGHRHDLHFEPVNPAGGRRDERRFVPACDGTYRRQDADTGDADGL